MTTKPNITEDMELIPCPDNHPGCCVAHYRKKPIVIDSTWIAEQRSRYDVTSMVEAEDFLAALDEIEELAKELVIYQTSLKDSDLEIERLTDKIQTYQNLADIEFKTTSNDSLTGFGRKALKDKIWSLEQQLSEARAKIEERDREIKRLKEIELAYHLDD